MEKKRVCILCFSNIAWDSRVLREIYLAARFYMVDVVGYGEWQPPEGVTFYRLTHTINQFVPKYLSIVFGFLVPAFWDRFFWSKQEYRKAEEIIIATQPDLIHANDFDGLPVAVRASGKLKNNPRVIFDAHEYTLDQGSEIPFIRSLMRPYREYILRKYGAGTDEMINVSEDRADLYRRHFDWNFKIILNAPDYVKCEYHPVNAEKIQLVHHGGTHRGRMLEDFIKMMPFLEPRFNLNFVLVSFDDEYLSYLKQLAQKLCPGRVRFWEPIPPAQLVSGLNQYDIGLPALRAASLNNLYGIPNKLYEYTNAGLAMAVSPLPTMKKLVEQHQIGVVATDQSCKAMADTLNNLTAEQINTFKQNSLQLAKTMNSAIEMEKLKHIYFDLVKP